VSGESFELYDLRVDVIAPSGAKIYCGAKPQDYFELRGEMLYLPPGQGFSIYSLAALLPLLPAKQRLLDANDWMASDAEVACPDPNCPSRFRITRTGKRKFERSATTATPKPQSRPHPIRAPQIADGARADSVQGANCGARLEHVEIAPGYRISRVIKGGWQLSGDHGPINAESAPGDMAAFVEAGITTFDCADIYTGVETLIGCFRKQYPSLAREARVHTKFVPDLAVLDRIDRAYVERTIDRSLERLGMERLDLVQFHWWDYASPKYVETALELVRLREKGKIAHIGVTNFDMPKLIELLDAGVPIVSHQLQYSLLDARPENGMAELCRRHNISLLCYGTVAGGFLSDRWLGQPEPPAAPTNRSLAKYQLIIDDFGGWALFQELLQTLRRIADKHGCDIATVASRAILERPGVAAVIVGATNTSHLESNRRIATLRLDDADRQAIAFVQSRRQGPEGDVYTLERDRTGRHGRIMKYDLNK
jgi:uncharacterized repeat protein (TIGR04076 family)